MNPTPNSNRHAVIAGFLGWTLDAFDFFVVVFLLDTLAAEFHVPKGQIVLTLTATLALRPVGALIFGMLADRYGRRGPLMANVIFFSVIELACGFSTSFTMFLVLRALFGIGMGGEWGVGASMAMESAPKKWRGVLSGILQSGYSIGFLLAAIASRVILPTFGWRAMFWIGALPALLALYIRSRVPESEAWREHRLSTFGAIGGTIAQHKRLFAYLVLMMTFMMFLSHGTQDLYPDFLKTSRHIAPGTVAYMTMLFNIGAITGAILFGHLSERLGRRRSMMLAMGLSMVVIPLWSFGSTILVLSVFAFLMQMGVQGAWGIIPVHLTEMAPDSVRGLMPGMAYQLGILFAAPTNSIQHWLSQKFGYSWALASFEVVTILALVVILSLGTENRGRSFSKGDL